MGHETGKFQVSPDFNEVPRRTGVIRARNDELNKATNRIIANFLEKDNKFHYYDFGIYYKNRLVMSIVK